MPPARALTKQAGALGRYGAAAVALTSVFAGGGAGARDVLPLSGWRTLEVGVLPVRSYVRGPEDLFEERAAVRRLREDAGVWQRRIESLLAARDEVHTVTAAEATKAISRSRDWREAVSVARERLGLGLERYRELKLDGALEDFARAAALYDQAHADLSESRDMADVELTRGLAHMERGEENLAHIAFRRMWLLDPSRQIDRGYYPRSTEEALAGALVDLAGLSDKALARFSPARLGALARRAGVDAWVLALVDGTPESPELQLSVFERRSGTLVLAERIPLDDGARAGDRLERALSGWHACAVTAAEDPLGGRPREPRWSLDLGYAHAIPLLHGGTRDVFHAPGIGVGLAWEAANAFELHVGMNQHTALPDPNRDLLEPFSYGRLSAGAGLAGGNRVLRGYARVGVDLGMTWGDLTLSTDVDCKHFGPEHPRCGKISSTPAGQVLVGFVVAAGLRLSLVSGWYLHTGLDLGTRLYPGDIAGDLDFPLTLSAGAGHRF